MELVQRGTVDQFGDLNAGTAADHWQLGMLHLRRSIQLTFGCGPSKPADGADVTVSSDSSDVDEDGTSSKNGVFLPTQPWKEVWDLWILGFILYSAVMVPYRICFSSGAEGLMFIFEQLITLSFLIDVGFNFNTAFMQDERWITDRGSIAVRYLQGWFWIDFPSAIPVELIDLLLEGDSSSLGMLRFLRLFRLLRLLRLLKVGEYVAALEIRFDINLTFLRIVQMVLQLLFLAHMLGCFWFYMAALVGIDMEITTWVSSYDDGRGVDAPPDVQYLYAVYWALTTLTTVRLAPVRVHVPARVGTCARILSSRACALHRTGGLRRHHAHERPRAPLLALRPPHRRARLRLHALVHRLARRGHRPPGSPLRGEDGRGILTLTLTLILARTLTLSPLPGRR